MADMQQQPPVLEEPAAAPVAVNLCSAKGVQGVQGQLQFVLASAAATSLTDLSDLANQAHMADAADHAIAEDTTQTKESAVVDADAGAWRANAPWVGRGLSLDLFYLPMSGARTSLVYHPSCDLTKRLNSDESWTVREEAVRAIDPASAVLQSQERLREYSGKRFGTQITDKEIEPATDAQTREALQLLEDILEGRPFSESPSLPGLPLLRLDSNLSALEKERVPLQHTHAVDEYKDVSSGRAESKQARGERSSDTSDRYGVAAVDGVTLSVPSLEELSAAFKRLAYDQAPSAAPAAALAAPSTPAFVTEQEERAGAGGSEEDGIDALLATPTLVPRGLDRAAVESSWAVTTYLPESEYDALRPRLALRYPFELDVFQRQAVLRLERRECVFVAAHTSAGKTVVAEYAIALCMQHRTRAVYTSPIKALSNQKYRDFKTKFGDVGLITGDISVNPDASCLLMTTEILRSMLYRGADIVRDIEWVIFDEVHYVNDAERGVVWEEVIIMLPSSVNLIFLSATTPNTVDFSDWIGRTKQRKVFVVSTNKRPVPLHHYLLYDNEVYPLMRGDTGFDASVIALAAKRERDKSKPKPASAEALKAAGSRAQEKANNAAVAMGKKGPVVAAAKEKPVAKGVGGAPKRVEIGGGKAQWLALIDVLRNGGRDQTGGLGSVDFGVGVVTKKNASRLAHAGYEPWEKLPSDVRAVMSKKEYEGAHYRASEDEPEGDAAGLLPVVIFSFSKKKCEENADYCRGLDLLVAREKGEVRAVMGQVFGRLNPQDRGLPQVVRVQDMLMRGLGVHHGGLLPILKEAVELLFSKSVVKVLFATETFAMGVNMPARAVVFNGYRKHDGRAFRDLTAGEYTQMAGRAGRRGLDKVGTVVIAAWTELPSELSLQTLLTGKATLLTSRFRLSYNMILGLLRANDLSVEDMIKRSFSEFHAQRALSTQDLAKKLVYCERELAESKQQYARRFEDDDRARVDAFLREYRRLRGGANNALRTVHGVPQWSLDSLLCCGRLVWLHSYALPGPCVGIIVGSAGKEQVMKKKADDRVMSDMASARASMMQEHEARGAVVKKEAFSEVALWVLVLVPGAPLDPQLSTTLKFTGVEASALVGETCMGVTRATAGSISAVLDVVCTSKPWLDFVNGSSPLSEEVLSWAEATAASCGSVDVKRTMGSNDIQLHQVGDMLSARYSLLADVSVFREQGMRECFAAAWTVEDLSEKAVMLKHYISNENLALFPDFRQRLGLLGHLDYVDASDAVLLKGRVACEMNTCDELLACEMLFSNVLEPLNPPEAAAILSALVFQEKVDDEPPLTTRMEAAKLHMGGLLKELTRLQEEDFGVSLDAENKPSLNFGLAAVVYEWARGTSFSTIAEMTMVHEGSIVRCITRLDELCKDFRNAARVVGNPSLYRKMEAASQCIRRDIVFAASMYVS